MHTQYATPIQKFITKEHYDMSPIAPAAKAFFSNNGKQLSMPFNISQPVMYYNASLLKKYHIPTPSKSPSYSEITKTAKELYQRSHHQVKGMTMEINGWLMEEALANAHQLLVNHQDGHAGAPDKINLNNPTSQKYLKWLQENIHAKDFMNYGSGSNAAANEIAGFMSGKVGIFFNTSAYISQLTVNPKLKWEFLIVLIQMASKEMVSALAVLLFGLERTNQNVQMVHLNLSNTPLSQKNKPNGRKQPVIWPSTKRRKY